MATPIPPPFPVEQAQEVIKWATETGKQAAIDLINQIKDWLGDPKRIADVSRQWAPNATNQVVTAAEGLAKATIDIGDFWEGRAQVGFDKYAAHLQAISATTRGVTEKVATTLTDSLTTIADTYKAAVDLISECAKALVDATKGVPDLVKGLITRDPIGILKGVLDQITNALNHFITAASNLAKSTIDILTKNAQTGLKLNAAESLLQIPDEPPASLGEPDWWKVRRAP